MISLIAAALASDLEAHELSNEFGRVLTKDGAEWRALHGWFSAEELAVFTYATETIGSLITSQGAEGLAPADHFAAFMTEHGLAPLDEEGL